MEMTDESNIILEQLVVHQVGNSLREEGINLSPKVYQFEDENVKELLLKYCLNPFNSEVFYRFFHETDLNLNPIYAEITKIFADPSSLYKQSVKITEYLYQKSAYPKIKRGEFYVVYFKNCLVDETTTDAIGLFKSDQKDLYLRVTTHETGLELSYDEGVSLKKMDKGCLIYNLDSRNGYRLNIVEPASKDETEALFWKDDFLQVVDLKNEHYLTKTYLDLCEGFCKDIYGEVHQIDKKEQVVFMNDSLNYFAKHERFDAEDFVQKVIKEPELVREFRNYQQDFAVTNEVDPDENFEIAREAVKTARRKFKNLLKLDSEIEIKLKNVSPEGCLQYIERGYDQNKKLNFYKVYFNQEE